MQFEINKKPYIWIEGSKFFMELNCLSLYKFATTLVILDLVKNFWDPILYIHKPNNLSSQKYIDWCDLIEIHSKNDTGIFWWNVNEFHAKIESYNVISNNRLEIKLSCIRELGDYDTVLLIDKHSVPYSPSRLIKELEWWLYSGEDGCRISIDSASNIDFYIV